MASKFLSPQTSTNNKKALLIGNNNYKSRTKLRFCTNDAEDLARELRSIGFEITIGVDKTYEQMDRMIEKFIKQICPDDLVLFFFAGHGYQWSEQNFLIPIDDDKIKEDIDLRFQAINAQNILEKIMHHQPSAAVMLLDCCRNNFARGLLNTTGLSGIPAVAGSFIAFACDANRTALDGSPNGRNGLFTSHVLEHITQPDTSIDDIMYSICDGVMRDTNDKQCPFRVSSLRRKVYLNQQSQLGPEIYIHRHRSIRKKWKQNGITVAGGNGKGNSLNQLSSPCGLFVDDVNQRLYIADFENHRILEWKYGEKCGRVVAGGNGLGNRSNKLYYPKDVIVDRKNDSLIICDWENRRVVQWPRQNGTDGEAIISNICCCHLTMDENRDIYISNGEKNEVRRWKLGEQRGIMVAGGNGKEADLNQLNQPSYLFVDEKHSVYVSDSGNYRIMKWTKGAQEGVVVAGGRARGDGLSQLSDPQGVVVDECGNIFVADSDNHRIMCWLNGSREGYVVVGGNGRGNQPDQFNRPVSLAFDQQSNMYVVDSVNNRVQKFIVD